MCSALAFRPDGKEVAVSTLDGQITFLDIQDSKQTKVLDGKNDVSGGRKLDDRVSAANNASGTSYNSMAYTTDGACLLAGGNSKYVVLYYVRERARVSRLKKSRSQRTFRSMGLRSFWIAGALTMLELMWTSSMIEMEVTWRIGWTRVFLELVEVLEICPFPFDGSDKRRVQNVFDSRRRVGLGPQRRLSFILWTRSLCRTGTPQGLGDGVPTQRNASYTKGFRFVVGEHLDQSPHLEFDLIWVNTLLMAHGCLLRDRSGEFASIFRVLPKGLTYFEQSMSKLWVCPPPL